MLILFKMSLWHFQQNHNLMVAIKKMSEDQQSHDDSSPGDQQSME